MASHQFFFFLIQFISHYLLWSLSDFQPWTPGLSSLLQLLLWRLHQGSKVRTKEMSSFSLHSPTVQHEHPRLHGWYTDCKILYFLYILYIMIKLYVINNCNHDKQIKIAQLVLQESQFLIVIEGARFDSHVISFYFLFSILVAWAHFFNIFIFLILILILFAWGKNRKVKYPNGTQRITTCTFWYPINLFRKCSGT